jgi:hypothetical protein
MRTLVRVTLSRPHPHRASIKNTARAERLWRTRHRLDVATGRRELWNTLGPADRAGVALIDWIIITPDGRAYAYKFTRSQTDLYQVTGLE